VNVLLVPAHPGFPGQIPQSRKTVVCVCVICNIHLIFESDSNGQVCAYCTGECINCAGELRNTLLEFEMGVRSNSSGGMVRKITPVTTRPQQQQSVEETSQLPLQVVFSMISQAL